MSNANHIKTPLYAYAERSSVLGMNQVGLVIKERSLQSHIILRGKLTDLKFSDAVEMASGLSLPAKPNTSTIIGADSIHWLGPNEWLLLGPHENHDDLISTINQHMSGHMAAVDVSGGQTVINLNGGAVHDVLMKSSVYDFHPDNFPQGKSVQTTFAKAGALINRVGQDSFDLVIRRSFADYIVQWLLDAGEEYGCKVECDAV